MVVVEAGVTLSSLHAWLRARGCELPCGPADGEATVGELLVDGGRGALGPLVWALTYVDHRGQVCKDGKSGSGSGYW